MERSIGLIFKQLPVKLLSVLLLFHLPVFPVNGIMSDPCFDEIFRDRTLAERLKTHVSLLSADAMEGRGLGTEGKVLAKKYIAHHFREFGLLAPNGDYFQHFDLRIGLARVPATNVVGYLMGSDPELQHEFIVIGAHYDHLGFEYSQNERVIYPGADDNASGVAVMIELARFYSQNPQLMGRSLIFIAFDAEESGLHGSRIFIGGNTLFDSDNIKLMFSLDMVGMYEANNGVEMRGISTLEDGTALVRKMAKAQNLSIKQTTADVESRTDTWPFGLTGIPAVHVFTGMKSPYHQPEDTYDLLDYSGMARITLYMLTLVSRLSMEPELTPSSRFVRLQNPWALRFNTGIIGHAGSTHHQYPDEFFRANNVFAFSSGLFVQMHVGRKFSFQQELLYDYNGSKSPEGTFRRHSLLFPLNLQVNLASQADLVRVFTIAGAYYRYNISGRDGGKDLDFNLNRRDEWGINLGMGIDLMRLHIAYKWRRGLSDISVNEGSGIFESGSYITVGYRF